MIMQMGFEKFNVDSSKALALKLRDPGQMENLVSEFLSSDFVKV